jgi:hypothetical protein
MNVKDYKAIVILFSPGQGGNHLANIISTSVHVADRFKTDDYCGELLAHYSSNSKNAHTSDIKNVGVFEIEQLSNTIDKSNKPIIISGHIDEAYFVHEYHIKSLGRIGFLTFEHFDLNNAIVKRMGKYDPNLSEFVYRARVVARMFQVDETDVLAINPNEFFIEDPIEFYKNLDKSLDLDLDLDFCVNLHKLWYNKITKTNNYWK